MRQIYKGKFFTMYGQVVLVDLEYAGGDVYPMWNGPDDEKVVFAPRGIAVGTANDVDVQVAVFVGEGLPAGRWISLGSGVVQVGSLGLGLESPTGDQDVLSWPPGEVQVAVYVNSTDREKVKKVALVFRADEQAAPEQQIAERVSTLIDKFKTQGAYLHDTAASALGKIGPHAIPAIIDAMEDPDPNVRDIAATALGHLRDPRSAEALITVLKDKSADVRRAAASALGNQKDPRTVEPLIAALSDPHTAVRHNAAAALGALNDKRAVEPLIARIRDREEDMFVQERAMESLGRLKDVRAIPHLVYALRRGNEHVRYAAARSFGYLGKPALSTLLELLEDKDSEMRRWAAFALGIVRRKEAVEPLIQALGDKETRAVAAAATALSSIRDERAVEPLIAMLQDRSADKRYIAADALVMVGDRRALPLLEQIIQNDNSATSWGSKVRDAATRAITSIQYREGDKQ